MDAIFLVKLLAVLPALLTGGSLPRGYSRHDWQQITPTTYVLSRRATRCKKVQCRGAALTVSTATWEDGRGGILGYQYEVRIRPFDKFGHVRCFMDLDMTVDPPVLRGCDNLRRK